MCVCILTLSSLFYTPSAMPALVAFGRTWEFGSDDLFFPGLVSSIVRIGSFIGILAGAVYFRAALTCQSSHLLGGFAAALLLMIALTIHIELGITILSARGSIVHTKPRRLIVHFVHFRVLFFILELVLLVIGTVFAVVSQGELGVNKDCRDFDKAVLVIQLSVAANWIIILFIVVAVVIYLDPCHCYSAKVNYSHVTKRVRDGDIDQTVVETQWRLNHTVWEKRFKVFCCLAGSDESHHLAYREVAEMFAHFFCDTNVVLSDIGAGFLLLQREHLTREALEREKVVSSVSDETDGDEVLASFDFHHEEDRELFKDMLHYLKYALGIYSWLFFVYMNPFCGLCRLCYRLRCCSNGLPNVSKDNSCMCHLSGLRQVTGLNELDIVYVSFENALYKVPFMVCLDHEMQSVVVTFRGTLSFPDIVTDLTAGTRPMQLPDYPDFLVHKGMLKTVTWVMEELKTRQVLEKAFNRANNYKLVIVGHSLGSGCACILSILLHEQYPDLKCYCYSPTGALLNEAAAEFTEQFVTSVTLGKDLVARMNIPNTHKLKEELVRVLESCRKPKCQILIEGALETLLSCFGRSVSLNQRRSNIRETDNFRDRQQAETDGENETMEEGSPLLLSEDVDSNPEQSLNVSSQQSTQTQNSQPGVSPEGSLEITPLLVPRLSSLRLPVRTTSPSPQNSLTVTQEVEHRLVPLFLPGKIIHIVDSEETKPCFFASRQVQARWVSRNSFESIIVSAEMFRDHLPDVLFNAMNKIWKEKKRELEDDVVRRPFSL